MEQQKITQNIQPNITSHVNIADISNTYPKTLRSLHNISNPNIKSKVKLSSGPQFVISYNFQNDPNCQVRTHNLLIGLEQISESNPKKNTFRKNALLRANPNSSSHSNLRISRNDSEHLRNKLIQVRSNEILTGKHKNEDSTLQSFYSKTKNNSNEKTRAQLQSFTHSSTFWRNEHTNTVTQEDKKNHHENYINTNITKIAHRKSSSKIISKPQMNVYTNSIQKISRNKISQIDNNKRPIREDQLSANKGKPVNIYELPDADKLQKDQSSRVSKTTKNQQEDQYNQKLQKILRKVKIQATKESLKKEYIKQEQVQQISSAPNKYGLVDHSSSKVSQTGQIENATYSNNHPISSQYEYQANQSQYSGALNPLVFSTISPAQKSISNYHKSLIEKQNSQKPKRKYRQLLKNNNNVIKNNKNSLFEEFHRIESQNENQSGSSKKQSKQQLSENNFPEKSVDFSINQHFINSQDFKANELQNKNKQQMQGSNFKGEIQRLEFTQNKQSKQIQELKNNNAASIPTKDKPSLRKNYHAPTSYDPSDQNPYMINERQRFNSSFDGQISPINKQQYDSMTKRKVPTDYKEFLRLLSEENQRRKSIQDLQKERELSLCAKTSRFKNVEAQNQHIKRVLTPIKHSFLEDRRKRLSDQRKINSKKFKQLEKNADGSIIQTESEVSDENGRKSHKIKNKNNLKRKFQKNNSSYDANNDRSQSQSENFREELYNSVQKLKGQGKVRKTNKQKSQQSKLKDIRNKESYPMNEVKSKAKFNSAFASSHANEGKPDGQRQNSGKVDNEFEKPNNHKSDDSSVQKLRGMKIPQKAIQRASSKMNRRKIGIHDQEKDETINNTKTKKLNQTNTQKNPTANKTTKSNNLTMNQKKHNQKGSQQIKDQTVNSKKTGMQGKTTQAEKRLPKQKQRNLKDWKKNQTQDKKHQIEATHTKKGRQVNEKDWKWAQKNKKNKKTESKDGHSSSDRNEDLEQSADDIKNDQHDQIVNQKSKKSTKKQQKNVSIVENKVDNQNKQVQIDLESDQYSDRQEEQRLQEKADKEKHQQGQEKNNKQRDDKIIYDGQYPTTINKVDDVREVKKSVPSIHKDVQQNNQLNHDSKVKSTQNLNDAESKNLNAESFTKSDNPLIQSAKIATVSSQQTLANQQNSIQNTKKMSQNSPKVNNQSLKPQIKKQIQQQQKKQMIQNVLQNDQMKENGFMEITESKFEIYNHESEKSIPSIACMNQIQQMQAQELQKRAQIVKFLYSLPLEYQSQVNKFIPNIDSQRLVDESSFSRVNTSTLQILKSDSLKLALEEIAVFDSFNQKNSIFKNNKGKEGPKSNNNFLRKIFQFYENLSGQIGVWIYCVGVWRLITVKKDEINYKNKNRDDKFLLSCLEKAFQKSLKEYYFNQSIDQVKHEQILRMITGLRVSVLLKSKTNSQKIFREIEYNTRKSHIIRAISSSQSRFSKETVNCVRKIESTPTGEKVLQIVSTSIHQIQFKPKYFWIKEDKFLDFFSSFIIISKKTTDSYWTNKFIEIKNEDKAVYMIESTQKHTSGSITLYPLNPGFKSDRQKCTIAFYKQIEPQVLKLVGKAIQRLPQNQTSAHTSKLYFQFNIKGTYYVFLELENGLYNVSIESNTSRTNMDFIEFVKKQTMKNQQCEYVEIDKIFRKKPDINAFQRSSEFKQLLNFMKKTSPEIYQAK